MWPFGQQSGILGDASALLDSKPRENFQMKAALPIGTLIRTRMSELEISRGELVKRLGYRNLAKGTHRIDALCNGDLERTKHLFELLPQALDTSPESVKLALEESFREIKSAEEQEAEAREKLWWENFRPHVVVLTERTVPSPIFVAAFVGVEKLLRIDLDLTRRPVSFVEQALERLPEAVIAFGRTTGFVINYSPEQAVRFDCEGQPIEIFDRAVRPGAACLHLGGRSVAAQTACLRAI
jgi:hypothetical protein